MTLIRKILGILFILFGLGGLIAAYTGYGVGQTIVRNVGGQTTETLTFAADSLSTVNESLAVAKTSLGQTEAAILSTQQTAVTLADSLGDTEPLFNDVSQVVTQDVPASLEAVQSTIPNLATAATVIDTTLRTLSNFGLDQNFLGFDLNFDLGIDYDPETPFDQSISELGASLDGVPEELRSLQVPLADTVTNLQQVQSDITQLSGDVGAIAGSVGEFEPQLDSYISIVGTTQAQLRDLSGSIGAELNRLESAVSYLMIWFALLQLIPIVYGLDLLFRRGERNAILDAVQKES